MGKYTKEVFDLPPEEFQKLVLKANPEETNELMKLIKERNDEELIKSKEEVNKILDKEIIDPIELSTLKLIVERIAMMKMQSKMIDELFEIKDKIDMSEKEQNTQNQA